MRHITEMTATDIESIKLIVFDVDGVLVPRGTRIRQQGSMTTLETKRIREEQIRQIEQLHELGFLLDISSGRGLYMLQEMFRSVLPFVSLTYENGSCTWHRGKLHQHVNSFTALKDALAKLQRVRHPNIKGFEPKELIVTIHCHDRVEEIEEIAREENSLYCLWNGEAYDFGMKGIQTKATGLENVMRLHGLSRENVMAIGDNYNDKEMVEAAGIGVTADRTRLESDFFVELEGERLPADVMMDQIISLRMPLALERMGERAQA